MRKHVAFKRKLKLNYISIYSKYNVRWALTNFFNKGWHENLINYQTSWTIWLKALNPDNGFWTVNCEWGRVRARVRSFQRIQTLRSAPTPRTIAAQIAIWSRIASWTKKSKVAIRIRPSVPWAHLAVRPWSPLCKQINMSAKRWSKNASHPLYVKSRKSSPLCIKMHSKFTKCVCY